MGQYPAVLLQDVRPRRVSHGIVLTALKEPRHCCCINSCGLLSVDASCVTCSVRVWQGWLRSGQASTHLSWPCHACRHMPAGLPLGVGKTVRSQAVLPSRSCTKRPGRPAWHQRDGSMLVVAASEWPHLDGQLVVVALAKLFCA